MNLEKNTLSQIVFLGVLYLFTYQSFGQKNSLDSTIYFINENFSGIFIPSEKQVFAYNTQEKMELLMNYKWEKNGNWWSLLDSTIYAYDSLNQVKITEKYEGNGVPSEKILFYRNLNNQLIKKEHFLWEANTNTWDSYLEELFTYDSFDNITENRELFLIPYRNLGVSKKTTYAYNTDQKITQRTDYILDTLQMIWDTIQRNELIYDSNNLHIVEDWVKWDSSSNIWKLYSRKEFHMLNDSVISSCTFYFNEIISGLQPERKYEWSFDSDGNNILTMSKPWSVWDSMWVNGIRNKNSYNTNYGKEKLILPPLEFENSNQNYYSIIFKWQSSFTSMLDENLFEVWQVSTNSTYYEFIKRWFYYSNRILSIEENPKNNQCSVYPNPVVENVHIEIPSNKGFATVRIFNQLGQLSLFLGVEGSQTINLEKLPSGIYYINIEYGDRMETFPIVKK